MIAPGGVSIRAGGRLRLALVVTALAAMASPGLVVAQPSASPEGSAHARQPVCGTGRLWDPPREAHPGDGVPDPDGRIVFGRFVREDPVKGQIVVLSAMDADGSDLAPVLDCEVARPRFSPDGTRLAFGIVMDDGSFQIGTSAADGTDLRILTDTPGYAETPDWSPDGSWLIYSHAPTPCVGDFDACVLEEGNAWTLWRMDADGTDQRRIGRADTNDWEPKISPDGARVVFQRTYAEDDWRTPLVVADLATGEDLFEFASTQSDRWLEHPDWSPDGRWIVYNPVGCDTCEQIERVPADDPTSTPVVLYPASEGVGGFKPVYSPDGSRIAFGCQPGLCLMDEDGSNVVILEEGPFQLNHFDWAATRP